ncbi:MAG: ribose 5-phosphate isomerase B [Clostridia bacterium]
MIIIGSDHTGIKLKKSIINYLYQNHIEYADVTNYENQDFDDYPDIAFTVCKKVLEKKSNLGIAICGTGVGISIACNKIRGIRAALCTDSYMAEMARKDNNANVICLGARLSIAEKTNYIEDIVDSFLNNFYEGGRHDARLNKIRDLENMNVERCN